MRDVYITSRANKILSTHANSLLTFAVDAVSSEAWPAGTVKAAIRVAAVGMMAASAVVDLTLVIVCKRQQTSGFSTAN